MGRVLLVLTIAIAEQQRIRINLLRLTSMDRLSPEWGLPTCC